MHLVGFTVEIYYDALPYERQMDQYDIGNPVITTFPHNI